MGDTHAEYFAVTEAALEAFAEAEPGGDDDALSRRQEALARLTVAHGGRMHVDAEVIHDWYDCGVEGSFDPAQRAAWEHLMRALGVEEAEEELPGWLTSAYRPDGWYLALTPPPALQDLARALDAHGFDDALLAGGLRVHGEEVAEDASLVRVVAFLREAARDGLWLVATESMS